MISVFLDGYELAIKTMTFSGGERNIKIEGFKDETWHFNNEQLSWKEYEKINVYAHIDSSDTIMDLLLVTDALNRMGKGNLRNVPRTLHLPYAPYARQDRAMVDGESVSSVVMAKIINLCDFREVVIDDPHSDVIASHINNVVIYEQHELAISILGEGFFEDSLIIAPDAGAIKKATKLSKAVGGGEVGVGIKHRDVETGFITGTGYTGPDVEGNRVIMVDDICDGGRTFIELAKVLREQGAKEIVLYVTHGIFSHGADVFDGTIDKVYSCYPWVKNLEGRNEKGIFKAVDTMFEFK